MHFLLLPRCFLGTPPGGEQAVGGNEELEVDGEAELRGEGEEGEGGAGGDLGKSAGVRGG